MPKEYRVTWDTVKRHTTVVSADNSAKAMLKVGKMLEAGPDETPSYEIIDVEEVEIREPWAA